MTISTIHLHQNTIWSQIQLSACVFTPQWGKCFKTSFLWCLEVSDKSVVPAGY